MQNRWREIKKTIDCNHLHRNYKL